MVYDRDYMRPVLTGSLSSRSVAPASRTLCIHPFALPVHYYLAAFMFSKKSSRIPGPYSPSMGFKIIFPIIFHYPRPRAALKRWRYFYEGLFLLIK